MWKKYIKKETKETALAALIRLIAWQFEYYSVSSQQPTQQFNFKKYLFFIFLVTSWYDILPREIKLCENSSKKLLVNASNESWEIGYPGKLQIENEKKHHHGYERVVKLFILFQLIENVTNNPKKSLQIKYNFFWIGSTEYQS